MQDTVIKGTGNSRKFRLPPNALTIFPDWPSFVAYCTADGAPCDLSGPVQEGCEVIGTMLNKANLLADATAELYGDELPDNPTPNDVFALLWDKLYRLSTGKVKLAVSVTTANGTPVPDVAISGITGVNGEQIFTGQNGRAVGYANAGSTTVSTYTHIDITNASKSVTTSQGGAYTVDLTVEKRNFWDAGSSKEVYISGLAKRVDVSVGAAGGGGCGKGGSGGGGGRTNKKEDVSFEPRSPYQAVVGAAGSGTLYSATSGGSSSFLGVFASGGSSGSAGYNAAGGTRNGNGGKSGTSSTYGLPGTDGTGTVFTSFTDETPWGGGGGGGSGRGASPTPYTNGGTPGGGAGGQENIAGISGNSGGGGGGGGTSATGGSGGSGKVTARIWFEEDLAE